MTGAGPTARPRWAEIVAVGSELLVPPRLDTNSIFITDRLGSPRHRGAGQDDCRRPSRRPRRRAPGCAASVRRHRAVRGPGADRRRPHAGGRGVGARPAHDGARRYRRADSCAVRRARRADARGEPQAGARAGRGRGHREPARHGAGPLDRAREPPGHPVARPAVGVEADVRPRRRRAARSEGRYGARVSPRAEDVRSHRVRSRRTGAARSIARGWTRRCPSRRRC